MPDARVLSPGRADAPALVLDEPLSFWGGVETATGRVADVHHPRHGAVVTGRVLVMPAGRGSSSSSSVLAETIRLGSGPAAIVLAEPDPILALGATVARELYGTSMPIVVVDATTFEGIVDGARVHVEAMAGDGRVVVGA
jgi:predicted aconitase with swiveling domain